MLSTVVELPSTEFRLRKTLYAEPVHGNYTAGLPVMRKLLTGQERLLGRDKERVIIAAECPATGAAHRLVNGLLPTLSFLASADRLS